MAADEKTEKATPKRRRDERKKGNIFQSHDLTSVLSLLVIFNALRLLAPYIYKYIRQAVQLFFSLAATMYPVTAGNIKDMLVKAVMLFGMAALPLLLVSMAGAVIFTAFQTKMLFSGDAIKFKGSRISPLKGFKRLFSLRSTIELLKAVVKISVLGVVIYLNIKSRIYEYPRLMDGSVVGALSFAGDSLVSLVNTVGIMFLVMGVFDYLYQWWDYEKNLRMSKQEIKEEYKQSEGDPQVKGKIKEKQRQMASMRMMQKVPEADVIIRNPTHYAVAIKYDSEKNHAPVVLAKGADRVALRIVAIGEEHGIYITEDRPLARGLFEAVEIDMEIPAQFYQAVAAILAVVYNMRKRKHTSK